VKYKSYDYKHTMAEIYTIYKLYIKYIYIKLGHR